MQTPKDKAKEIFDGFYLFMPFKDVKLTSCKEDKSLVIEMELLSAKQCALFSVELIIKAVQEDFGRVGRDSVINWYGKVKEEIELIC